MPLEVDSKGLYRRFGHREVRFMEKAVALSLQNLKKSQKKLLAY